MDIGEVKQELINGKRITKSSFPSGTWLEFINGRIFKMILNTGGVWNPTQQDILDTDYKIYI